MKPKELNWNELIVKHTATTPLNIYIIQSMEKTSEEGEGIKFTCGTDNYFGQELEFNYDTLEDAKKAAQEHYNKIALSLLKQEEPDKQRNKIQHT